MIDRLDHIVLNCRDVAATAAWYEQALGLQREVFGPRPDRLKFGGQKINLRPVGAENWITGRPSGWRRRPLLDRRRWARRRARAPRRRRGRGDLGRSRAPGRPGR